jgi:hypothetical protein
VNWETVAGTIGVCTFAVAVLGAVWTLSRVKGLTASTQLLAQANAELREQVHTLREDHAREVGKLQGQIDALTGGLAERIVEAVLEHVAVLKQ